MTSPLLFKPFPKSKHFKLPRAKKLHPKLDKQDCFHRQVLMLTDIQPNAIQIANFSTTLSMSYIRNTDTADSILESNNDQQLLTYIGAPQLPDKFCPLTQKTYNDSQPRFSSPH